MTDIGTEHPRFLPQLNREAAPNPSGANAGWTEHGNGVVTLAKYSAALVVAGRDTPPERLKSIPSPWSRLLLFEQALFQRSHPAHKQVLAEWRGLMGCLGLAEYLRLQISVTPVDFDGVAGPMQVLRSMAPAGDADQLWNHHVLISIGGRLVGGTSPRTLVFTGIRSSAPPSVPFQRNSRLLDPTAHYREAGDAESLLVLERWLARTGEWLREVEGPLTRFLGVQPAAPGSDPVSRAELVKKLLAEWHTETLSALEAAESSPAAEISFAKSKLIANGFPDDHPAAEVFAALRFARVVISDRPSDMRLRGGDKVFNPGARGILLRDNNPYTGRIQLPAGQHGSVKRGRFELALTAEQLGDPGAPDLGTFFEPKLIEVVGAAPGHVTTLPVDGKQYLYPFRADILAHLGPDALIAYTAADGDAATGIRVRLDIPLHNELVLRYEQDYLARDVIRDAGTPNLAVWPDFQSEGWNHHFYFVHALQRPSLAMTPIGDVQGGERTSPEGSFTWGRLLKPARAWIGTAGAASGLLVASEVTSVVADGSTWDVAVDFGSTHTRVFRRTEHVAGKSQAHPVDLKPRATTLLGTEGQLADSFFPALAALQSLGSTEEPRSLVRLPIGRTRAGLDVPWVPSDGVIYWGSLMGEAPPGLRANLKWHRRDSEDLPAFHSYISQLYLSVAAEAASAGASVQSVVTAYPSVFPEHLRHNHEQQWKTLEPEFNVEVKPPVSESDALAAYLNAERGAAVGTNLLAVDVGGSTSDLAVWTSEKAGDSIRMAGDILSRLLAVDAPAREAIQKAAAAQPIAAKDLQWLSQGDMVNGLIFNGLLRAVVRKTGSTLMLAKNMYQGRGSAGERVIAHAGYLYAVVSYLLGLMVRKQGAVSDRYEIHFAGHGSEFLKWLDVVEDNASSALPAAFFRAALGKTEQPVRVDVQLPGEDVKQEVARGLLASSVGESKARRDRITFVGEDGFTGGEGEGWSKELSFDTLTALQAPAQPVALERLTHISRFVNVFVTDPVARSFARALGITPGVLDAKLRDTINHRLFGPQSAWKLAKTSGTEGDDTLVEPFFVIEAKALLEHVTGNNGLFSV